MATSPNVVRTSRAFTPQSDAADRSALVTMPAFPRSLSPASRRAFGIADAIRLQREREGVGTDHLFLGLFADAGGAARRGAAQAGIDERTLIELFGAAGLDSPAIPVSPDGEAQTRWPEPTSLQPAPPVSPALQRIILSAEHLASVRPMESGSIEPRHLLQALGTDTANPLTPVLSNAWPYILALVADAPPSSVGDDALVVRVLSDEALNELVGSLSISSRKALGVADALRRERGQSAVHMEHLLVGLHVENGGHQNERLRDAGLDLSALRERLTRFELALATTGDAPGFAAPAADPIVAMPPLSPHVRLALSATAMLGGWSPGTSLPDGTVIQARLLLAGWFAVRECSVVRALQDRRSAVRDGVRAQIQTDPVSDVQWMLALLARLDALLGEPPRVGWQPFGNDKPHVRTGMGGGGTNDRADGVDRLRFGDYVRAFADLIDSPDTNPPLTIGIFGAWGAGKSFLLQKLIATMADRRKLARDAASSERRRAPVYTVAFNAWEYNAAPQIWPRLVRRVLDSVESSLDWRTRIRIRLRGLGPNLRRKAADDWKSIVAWGIIVAFLVLLTRNATDTATNVFQFTIGKTIEKLTLPGLVGGLVSLAALLVKSFIAPVGEWITAALDDGRSYGLESVAMAIVRRDLERLDARLASEGSRLLVVIDDLDRCEPEKAVEMLQAINLLLDRPSFVICLGIDARVVTAAVERHYHETLGRAGITGYEYLDKIVQIPFTIPEPTKDDLIVFLEGQLDRSKPDAQTAGKAASPPTSPPPIPMPMPSDPTLRADVPAGDEAAEPVVVSPPPAPTPTDVLEALSFSDEEKTAFRAVAPFMRRNPRHVKRIVNVYTLVRALAARRAEQRILDDPESTILWLTLCAQWPYSLREMLRQFEAHASAIATPAKTPLRVLYDATLPSFVPARQARFDQDPQTLARLVDASGSLEWDEIRILRLYTENFNPAIEGELRVDRPRRLRRRSSPME